ncbi:hypothetical protein FACS1894201_08590 [Bacteroidia bacterium]|nr:hypothetical protein FACS1894201_08590 [Bacteroidia bacterium]
MYDDYGNVLTSATTNGGTSTTVTTNTYLTTASRSYSNRLSTTESKTYKTNPSTSYPQRQKFTYDTKGNVQSVIENYGLPIACTTSNVLNSYGLPTQTTLTATGVPARTTSYGYDSKYRYQTSVTTGIGRSAKRYNALGQLLNDTAIGGQVTSYSYDRFGTLVQTQHPGGIVTNYKIRRNYDGSNALYVTTEQTTGQAYTKKYIDILGRVIVTEQPNPSGIVFTETNYNTKGQVTAVSIPHYTNETVQWKTYAYDVFGRQTAETYQGQTTSYGYSGLTSTVTSPSGQVSSKTYNASGDLVSATDNGGTITYAYDVPGYVKTITAPGNAVTQITYDSYGRQTSITDPDAGTVSYTYNALGDIITQTDALNHVTTNAYDAYGRLSTVTESGGRVTTYTYIASGANKGQLQSISCNNGSSHSYAYDAYNRTTQFTDVLGTNTLTTQYQYNSYGQLYRQQYPSGLRLLYYYNNGYQVAVLESYEDEDEDEDEEVEEEEEGGGEGENVLLWSLGSVNARGQELSSMLMDGNRTQTNTYNAFGQLTARTITGLMNQTYSYQASTGNMTQRVDNLHSKTENFTYDNLSRLTTGTGYHSNGNIASKTGVGYYDYHLTKKHAVIKVETGFCNQNITYNSFNKVNGIVYSGCVGVEVEANMEDEVETEGESYALSMSFVYGPTHERRKVSGNDMLNNAFERYYSTNYERTVYGGTEVVKEYIFSPYGLIAIRNNGVIKEVATDHLGSIIAEYKPGTGYEYFGYDAWGRRYKYGVGNVQIYFDTNTTLRDGAHLLTLFTRGYTGHEHLDMFGLINMNGRLYDPAIGRMLSPDPYVQLPTYTQSFNRYSYCLNNPLKYTDPNGEWWGIDDLVVVGAGFIIGYVGHGLSTGDWGGKALLAGGIGAGMAWLGYNTAGLATGKITTATWNHVGNMAINAVANQIMPSMNIPIGDHFGINVSSAFGLGSGGLTIGYNVTGVYSNDDLSISAGIGVGSNYFGGNASATYQGYGYGFGQTIYGSTEVYGKQLEPQRIGTHTVYFNHNSFSLSNDYFGDKQDRYRTNAAELTIGKWSIGTYLYTNDGRKASNNKLDESENGIPPWPVGIKHNGKMQTWTNGRPYSAPLWVGYRNGNQVTRIGYSHKVIHNMTQNMVHKYRDTPYYMDYDEFRTGGYFYNGYRNPLSLWDR